MTNGRNVAYLNTHYNTLLPKQQKVRERVIFAANRDMNDFFGLVFDAAVPVKSAFPNSPPPEGECAGINAPAFTMLRELTSRGSLSPQGRMDTALEVPRLGGVTVAAKPPNRKTGAGGAHPPATRQRADWPFVAGLQQIRTPEGMCHFAWRRQQCTRNNCQYSHGPFVKDGTGAPGLPCPPPPHRYQQRQQQQPPPAAVAKFSFSHG